MGKTFFWYLQYRLHMLILYAASAGVYLAVHFLSGQAGSFTWYAVLLTGVILILVLLPNAAVFFKKHRTLRTLADTLSEFEPEFPETSNLLERDYTQLAKGLYRSFRKAQEEILSAQAQHLEYYTLWVHQIKTPISAMQLVLQNMPDSPEKAMLLQELFGIERYTELALQYARLGSIASDLVIAPCNLDEVVRACVKKYALLFVYKKLSVEMDCLSLSVVSDAKWLGFILEQILSNAVKYTAAGGVRIYADNGSLVIEDTGMGIRPEDLPRIFEKGYTGYTGRTDTRASGIGLYLCKKAADALSISICAVSKLGKGTRFTLSFPKSDDFIFRQ